MRAAFDGAVACTAMHEGRCRDGAKLRAMPFHGRPWIGALASLFFLLASGGARAEQRYGGLYLSTLPSGANVWIDGTYVGHSPVLIDALPRGHHAVTLSKSGWSVQEVEVDIVSGTTTMSGFRLRAQAKHSAAVHGQGSVAFRGVGTGVRISIDGDPLAGDPTATIPLIAGSHFAVITASSRKTSRMFTVYPDTTTEVVLAGDAHSDRLGAVVAPAEEFLPDSAYSVAGKKIVLRYGGHQVLATIGDSAVRFDGVTISYDTPPSRINGRLYLPLALLTKLTSAKGK